MNNTNSNCNQRLSDDAAAIYAQYQGKARAELVSRGIILAHAERQGVGMPEVLAKLDEILTLLKREEHPAEQPKIDSLANIPDEIF